MTRTMDNWTADKADAVVGKTLPSHQQRGIAGNSVCRADRCG